MAAWQPERRQDQNSIRDLVEYDPATGDVGVVKHVTYDAFGNVIADSAPGVESLFLYTARPFDAETGLQNNLHRWYDPATGRWLSEDPIGFNGDAGNLYRYCNNSPVNWVDPCGESLIGDVLRGAGNAIVELKAYVTDVVIVSIDTIGEVTGGWDLDYDENSRYGQATRFEQPDYMTRYRVVENTVGRAGLAGLTLGGSEIYFGAEDYLRTGDEVTLREHMGGVLVVNSIAAGTAKAPVFRPIRPPIAPRNPAGTYRPSSPLPRGTNGELLPSSRYPHTQLGTEIGRNVGPYTAAREFGLNGRPIRDIHFTDHGRPSIPGHTNPHQHLHIPNPTGGTPQYGGAEPFVP